MECRWLVILCLMLGACCAGASAQPQAPRISHVVMGPGQEVYEKFGHNALRVEDPAERGEYRDVAFNYGLFSFSDDFIFRFLRGDLIYWMAPERAPEMLEAYSADGRRLSVQVLDLSAAQARDLGLFLWTNAEPEKRDYRYDAYIDNCSTRVRDALDRATGGAIREQTQNVMTGRTYRFHTRRAMANSPLAAIGLEYVLGPAMDVELSRWQEMFLPALLQLHLREVMLQTPEGTRPLVAEERLVSAGTLGDLPEAPPVLVPWYLMAGLLIAVALLATSRFAERSRFARVLFSTAMLAWFALCTFAAAVLIMLTLFSTHWPVYRNENILQMSPAALLTLAALPWALRRGDRHRRMRRFAAVTAGIGLALSVLGLALKAIPAFSQDNWTIILLSLPAHAAAATALWQRQRQGVPSEQT